MSFIVHGKIRFQSQVYLIKNPTLFKKYQAIWPLVKCEFKYTKKMYSIHAYTIARKQIKGKVELQMYRKPSGKYYISVAS